jgi:hypothetical protein
MQMRILPTITRLYTNPVFLALYVVIYLFGIFAITYLWHARMALKVVATIFWMFLTPDLEDLGNAWKSWRRKPRGRG